MAGIRFTDNSGEVLALMAKNATDALTAMGQAAVGLIAGRIASGYGRPIRRTGALQRDVSFEVGDGTVDVGSSLDYALPVHEGTSRMAGRPFITDALTGGAGELQAAAEKRLRQGF